MKKYEWIIFDVDDTLFNWNAFQGIKHTFSSYGLEFTERDYQDYQLINKALWAEYQKGTIQTRDIQEQRFLKYANQLTNISAVDLDNAFLETMATLCEPIEGAISLLNSLKGKAKLGIITNGNEYLLKRRLNRHNWMQHFEFLVISETLGIAKPQKAIFEHAFSLMGNPMRENILMVGDTFESDIVGGINAGIDTCWLNRHNHIPEIKVTPHYQVNSLIELENLLLKHY